MASYTNEYSRLPNEILTLHNYKDVDDTVAPYVNQIKILQAQGKDGKVKEMRKARAGVGPDVFGAEDAMALQEETRNLEILALSKKQCVYYQEEEPDGGNANVWIR